MTAMASSCSCGSDMICATTQVVVVFPPLQGDIHRTDSGLDSGVWVILPPDRPISGTPNPFGFAGKEWVRSLDREASDLANQRLAALMA